MIAPSRLHQTGNGSVSTGNGIEFFPVNHANTFVGRASTMASTYREYDVALRNSIENARLMRNDSSIMECLEARQRAVALLKWHIEPEDDRSLEQKQLAEEMTKVMMRTPRFMEMRRVLQEAVWYGKSAVQVMYNTDWIGGYRRFCILSPDRDTPAWLPIHGDKLVFRHDDLTELDRSRGRYPFQVGIRVGGSFQPGQKVRGKYEVEAVASQFRGTEAVDRGMAYFVDQEDRQKLIIHKHSIEDGAYEDILSAGSIHGVGVRSRIYWDWIQKQEIQAMLLAYIERYHGGIEIYRFPLGNDEAEKAVDSAIRNRQPGRAALKVPVPMGEDAMQYGVEVFESSMAGVQQMQDLLTNFYGHRIKRYILGQILSSESEATGLGSGVADLHLESLLQIIEYDATGLEETITEEPLRRLQHANFPSSKGIRLRFKIDTREADSDAKLNAVRQAWEMGARVKESDVLDQCGLSAPTQSDRVLPAPGGGGGQQPPGLPGMPPQGPPKVQASVPDTVAADPQPEPAQYARQGTFNWDESEHPRNDKGEFVERAGESAPTPRKQLREGQVEMRQAKAGGETSDVDGKFYKGGQWLPVHGLYSGQEKPDKADKPEIATEDKFTPVASENGKGGRPVARQRSPEDVENERQRLKEEKNWNTVANGPLGRALHLRERPHFIKHTHGSLPAWTELARSGEVSDDRFEAVSEWAEQKSRKTHDEMVRPLGGSAYVPSNRYGAEKVSDADWAWEQSQVTDAAKADIEWVSKRNDRKVLKQHPQVALARAWVSHLLSNDQSAETLGTLHRLLTGEGGESGQELGESDKYAMDWKSITAMTVNQFRNWIEDGDSGSPILDQVSRYGMNWKEDEHPRDNNGKFAKKSKGQSMHDFQIDPDARSKWMSTGQAAAFRVQDSRFPLPEKSKSTWHGDEEETMPGVSGYANFINAWQDIVFGVNESVTGDNYSQQVTASGGQPSLVVMQGREIDGPGAEIIVPNPKIAAVFRKDDLVKSFREYIGEAYGSLDEHDYRTAPIDEILSSYEWSQEDIEGAVNYLLSHQAKV